VKLLDGKVTEIIVPTTATLLSATGNVWHEDTNEMRFSSSFKLHFIYDKQDEDVIRRRFVPFWSGSSTFSHYEQGEFQLKHLLSFSFPRVGDGKDFHLFELVVVPHKITYSEIDV
jgi:hypothetical protein